MFADNVKNRNTINRSVANGLDAYYLRGLFYSHSVEAARKITRARIRKGTLQVLDTNGGWFDVNRDLDHVYFR